MFSNFFCTVRGHTIIWKNNFPFFWQFFFIGLVNLLPITSSISLQCLPSSDPELAAAESISHPFIRKVFSYKHSCNGMLSHGTTRKTIFQCKFCVSVLPISSKYFLQCLCLTAYKVNAFESRSCQLPSAFFALFQYLKSYGKQGRM